MDEAVRVLATALTAYVTLLGSRLAFQPPPRLAHAELGDMAGCLGAALLAWRPAGHETMVAARERRS